MAQNQEHFQPTWIIYSMYLIEHNSILSSCQFVKFKKWWVGTSVFDWEEFKNE